MTESLPTPAVGINLLMLGISGYLALYQIWLWRVSRDRVHAWTAGWCSVAIVLLVGRLLQRTALVAATASLGTRLQVAAALLIVPVTIGMALAKSTDRSPPRWLLTTVAIATPLLIFGVIATELFVTSRAYTRVDLLGATYLGLHPGPLLPLIGLIVVACAAYGVLLLRHSSLTGRERAAWWVLAPLCLVTGLNDVAQLARLLKTVHLFEYGIFGVTLYVGWLSVQRYHGVLQRLERLIELRTQQLELADDSARQSAARFRQIAEASAEGIVVHDGKVIVDANHNLARLFGEPRAEAFGGRAALSLFDESSQAEAEALLAGEVSGPLELRCRRKDGTTFPAETTGRRTSDEGRTVGLLALRDLTQRKRVEAGAALSHRMMSLGTLAAGTAHEINNPLTCIKTNVQYLADQLRADDRGASGNARKTEDWIAGLDDAAEGCQRIERIVQALRTFASTDERVGPVDVHRALETAIQMTHNEVRHRARLVRQLHGEPLPPVRGDEARIAELFVHLLANAAQALPHGATADNRIEVRTRPLADGRIEIAVSDTGPGIPPGDRERVFDPFFTTKEIGRGMGLGLSVCHNTVAALGGEIAVRSRVGGGTTFTVTLPASELEAAAAGTARVERGRRPGTGEAGRIRVLVIDDEPGVLRALHRLLRKLYDVTVVERGDEALALCAARRFDAVVCDVMMPEMSGEEIHRALAERDAELARRMIFITGAYGAEAVDFVEKLDNLCLDKPVDFEALQSMIDELGPRDDEPAADRPTRAGSGL